jgi:septal ring factor EnvC (AmiA/AmiB activator)
MGNALTATTGPARGILGCLEGFLHTLNRPFTITVHDVAGSDLAKVSNDMAQRSLRTRAGRSENVVDFARPSAPDCGVAALNLVYQAAEIFSGMEDQARETEARAQSLCKSAAERLKLAEKRTEAAERERWETILEVDCRLQDASRALKQAQSRLAANEDRLTALEFRAQAAEVEARDAKQALALVAEAIRRRLLSASPEAVAG